MVGHAFGKVILLGDHAVAQGRSALVAALGRGVRAEARPGEPELWSGGALVARPGDGSDLGTAFGALLAAAGRSARVEVSFDLPVRAGLGSSAAFAVALARALEVPEDRVFEVAQVSERVFHGAPSGVDVEAARRGGIGRFSRARGFCEVLAQPLTLCVGLDGRPRETRRMVARVARLAEEDPALGAQLLDGIAALVDRGEAALAKGDGAALGRLFDAHHGYLGALGVSTPELDLLCHLARREGALGAKLTGAGGGGAVIALAPGREAEVVGAWQAAGFEGFVELVPCTR